MSTRAVVNFRESESGSKQKTIVAKIYRHSDGYPDGLGKDLKKFLKIVKTTLDDTRFGDASYLAAKWVVHDSARYNVNTDWSNGGTETRKENPLDFLSVGIVTENPGDIEYEYFVDCSASNKMPKISHKKI